jgi:hypothetical protein
VSRASRPTVEPALRVENGRLVEDEGHVIARRAEVVGIDLEADEESALADRA